MGRIIPSRRLDIQAEREDRIKQVNNREETTDEAAKNVN